MWTADFTVPSLSDHWACSHLLTFWLTDKSSSKKHISSKFVEKSQEFNEIHENSINLIDKRMKIDEIDDERYISVQNRWYFDENR